MTTSDMFVLWMLTMIIGVILFGVVVWNYD